MYVIQKKYFFELLRQESKKVTGNGPSIFIISKINIVKL